MVFMKVRRLIISVVVAKVMDASTEGVELAEIKRRKAARRNIQAAQRKWKFLYTRRRQGGFASSQIYIYIKQEEAARKRATQVGWSG
jgi:acyl-[acyl carrier protein]--UDP-N-acetylglucosamine O-acyltransferase